MKIILVIVLLFTIIRGDEEANEPMIQKIIKTGNEAAPSQATGSGVVSVNRLPTIICIAVHSTAIKNL